MDNLIERFKSTYHEFDNDLIFVRLGKSRVNPKNTLMYMIDEIQNLDEKNLKLVEEGSYFRFREELRNDNPGKAGKKVIKNKILNEAKIIFSTLTGISSLCNDKVSKDFWAVVVDEAGQAPDASLLQPLTQCHCQRLILAGDDKQLPPFGSSDLAKTIMLDKSPFERIMALKKEHAVILRVSYRMEINILNLVNDLTYNDYPLQPPPEANTNYKGDNIVFYNLKHTKEEKVKNSICNKGNAAEVIRLLGWLYDNHGSVFGITVITFYSAQLEILRDMYNLTNVKEFRFIPWIRSKGRKMI